MRCVDAVPSGILTGAELVNLCVIGWRFCTTLNL